MIASIADTGCVAPVCFARGGVLPMVFTVRMGFPSARGVQIIFRLLMR